MKVCVIAIAGSMLLATGAAAQGINDAQIASIVVTANQVDIDAGKLAAARATNAEVKKFGQTMASDHAGVNKQAVALAKKLGVKPEDNPTSKSLYDGGKTNVDKLKGLKGAAFDKAYIDNEVAYHTAVLDAVAERRPARELGEPGGSQSAGRRVEGDTAEADEDAQVLEQFELADEVAGARA